MVAIVAGVNAGVASIQPGVPPTAAPPVGQVPGAGLGSVTMRQVTLIMFGA